MPTEVSLLKDPPSSQPSTDQTEKSSLSPCEPDDEGCADKEERRVAGKWLVYEAAGWEGGRRTKFLAPINNS